MKVKSGTPPTDGIATATYIAELSSTLAGLAREHGFDALGYLLDLARLEAETISRQGAPMRLPPQTPSSQ